ncbi:MAG: hypothetical protein AB7N71_03570 [Phycisphaerae bacterium]
MTAPMDQHQPREVSAYQEVAAPVPFRSEATRDALMDVLEESVRKIDGSGAADISREAMIALADRFPDRAACDREIAGAMLTVSMSEIWQPFFARDTELQNRIMSAIVEAMMAHPASTERLEQLWRLIRAHATRVSGDRE